MDGHQLTQAEADMCCVCPDSVKAAGLQCIFSIESDFAFHRKPHVTQKEYRQMEKYVVEATKAIEVANAEGFVETVEVAEVEGVATAAELAKAIGFLEAIEEAKALGIAKTIEEARAARVPQNELSALHAKIDAQADIIRALRAKVEASENAYRTLQLEMERVRAAYVTSLRRR
mmetsp:Transcript_27817/g.45206  ORF Transcript_27817/g.45206 Transcript_27817/m.45206 type:complete len:174 (-) Transcript_27817:141-662(-)